MPGQLRRDTTHTGAVLDLKKRRYLFGQSTLMYSNVIVNTFTYVPSGAKTCLQ